MHRILPKGQLISKRLFGVFNFFQKMNENKSIWGIIVVKTNSVIWFLEETSAWKNHFDFVWPLLLRFAHWTQLFFWPAFCSYIGDQLLFLAKKIDIDSSDSIFCSHWERKKHVENPRIPQKCEQNSRNIPCDDVNICNWCESWALARQVRCGSPVVYKSMAWVMEYQYWVYKIRTVFA